MSRSLSIWDEASSKAWDAILDELRKRRDEGKTMEAIGQEMGGVASGAISMWLSGDRQGTRISFQNMLRYLDILGLDYRDFLPLPSSPRIKEIEPGSPEDMITLPVYAVAGAGPAWDDETSEARFYIAVPRQYVTSRITTLLVSGESMTPTILDNAVVGVNRDLTEIVQGKIYAVRLPYEGIVVKRVFLDHAKKCFILRSDNKNGDYPDILLPFEEGDSFIYGQVEWLLQSYKPLNFEKR